jgi:hypothetical protein
VDLHLLVQRSDEEVVLIAAADLARMREPERVDLVIARLATGVT